MSCPVSEARKVLKFLFPDLKKVKASSVCDLLSEKLDFDIVSSDAELLRITRYDRLKKRVRIRLPNGSQIYFLKKRGASLKRLDFDEDECPINMQAFVHALQDMKIPRQVKLSFVRPLASLKVESPADECQSLTESLHSILPGLSKSIRVKKYLGKGSHGMVLDVLLDSKRYALKIVFTDKAKHIEDEYSMQKAMHAIGLAPAVVSELYNSHRQFRHKRDRVTAYAFFMQKIEGVATTILLRESEEEFELLLSRLLVLIKQVAKAGLSHGDMWSDNVSITSDGELSLIDFGWTAQVVFPIIDAMQFFRGTFIVFSNEFGGEPCSDQYDYFCSNPVLLVRRLLKILKKVVQPIHKTFGSKDTTLHLKTIQVELEKLIKKRPSNITAAIKRLDSIFKKHVDPDFQALFAKYSA